MCLESRGIGKWDSSENKEVGGGFRLYSPPTTTRVRHLGGKTSRGWVLVLSNEVWEKVKKGGGGKIQKGRTEEEIERTKSVSGLIRLRKGSQEPERRRVGAGVINAEKVKTSRGEKRENPVERIKRPGRAQVRAPELEKKGGAGQASLKPVLTCCRGSGPARLQSGTACRVRGNVKEVEKGWRLRYPWTSFCGGRKAPDLKCGPRWVKKSRWANVKGERTADKQAGYSLVQEP